MVVVPFRRRPRSRPRVHRGGGRGKHASGACEVVALLFDAMIFCDVNSNDRFKAAGVSFFRVFFLEFETCVFFVTEQTDRKGAKKELMVGCQQQTQPLFVARRIRRI